MRNKLGRLSEKGFTFGDLPIDVGFVAFGEIPGHHNRRTI